MTIQSHTWFLLGIQEMPAMKWPLMQHLRWKSNFLNWKNAERIDLVWAYGCQSHHSTFGGIEIVWWNLHRPCWSPTIKWLQRFSHSFEVKSNSTYILTFNLNHMLLVLKTYIRLIIHSVNARFISKTSESFLYKWILFIA